MAVAVVIVEAVRTPIGRGHPEKGYYKDTHPNGLLGRTPRGDRARRSIPADAVEDVICGCVQQYGEQMFNVSRNAWLPGRAAGGDARHDRRPTRCGSAQQAFNGAALIAAGVHDVVIGGGVDTPGHIPMGIAFKWVDDVGSPWPPELLERYNLVHQGISAEMIADKWEDSAVRWMSSRCVRTSWPRAPPRRASSSARRFVPGQRLHLRVRPGDPPRAQPRGAGGARSRPSGRTARSAGNSSQISDGAAAVLLMSAEKAAELGVTPPGADRGPDDQSGVDPVMMLTGPIPATRKLLERNGADDGRHRSRRDRTRRSRRSCWPGSGARAGMGV